MSLLLDNSSVLATDDHDSLDEDSGLVFLNREVRRAIEDAGDGVTSILESQLRVRLAGLIEERRSALEERVGFHFSASSLLEKLQPRFFNRIVQDAAKIVRESAGVDYTVQAGPIATRYIADVTDDDLVEVIATMKD